MTITLNHTIVPAVDNETAARFFAEVMGLTYQNGVPPHQGRPGAVGERHFAPVRVNDDLTLDFMTVDRPSAVHLAFDVDPQTFDGILSRLRIGDIPYGSEPRDPANGRIDHPLCPRGLYFQDEAGNLYEVMSPA